MTSSTIHEIWRLVYICVEKEPTTNGHHVDHSIVDLETIITLTFLNYIAYLDANNFVVV